MRIGSTSHQRAVVQTHDPPPPPRPGAPPVPRCRVLVQVPLAGGFSTWPVAVSVHHRAYRHLCRAPRCARQPQRGASSRCHAGSRSRSAGDPCDCSLMGFTPARTPIGCDLGGAGVARRFFILARASDPGRHVEGFHECSWAPAREPTLGSCSCRHSVPASRAPASRAKPRASSIPETDLCFDMGVRRAPCSREQSSSPLPRGTWTTSAPAYYCSRGGSRHGRGTIICDKTHADDVRWHDVRLHQPGTPDHSTTSSPLPVDGEPDQNNIVVRGFLSSTLSHPSATPSSRNAPKLQGRYVGLPQDKLKEPAGPRHRHRPPKPVVPLIAYLATPRPAPPSCDDVRKANIVICSTFTEADHKERAQVGAYYCTPRAIAE